MNNRMRCDYHCTTWFFFSFLIFPALKSVPPNVLFLLKLIPSFAFLARTLHAPTNRAYVTSAKLNEGTFGCVYKGRLVDPSKLAAGDDGTRALKKLKADKHPGFPVTALREIIIMQQLVDPSTSYRHPNIGVLQEVVVDPESLSDLDKGGGVSMASHKKRSIY